MKARTRRMCHRSAGLRHGAFARTRTKNAVPEAGAPPHDFPVGGRVKMRPEDATGAAPCRTAACRICICLGVAFKPPLNRWVFFLVLQQSFRDLVRARFRLQLGPLDVELSAKPGHLTFG